MKTIAYSKSSSKKIGWWRASVQYGSDSHNGRPDYFYGLREVSRKYIAKMATQDQKRSTYELNSNFFCSAIKRKSNHLNTLSYVLNITTPLASMVRTITASSLDNKRAHRWPKRLLPTNKSISTLAAERSDVQSLSTTISPR